MVYTMMQDNIRHLNNCYVCGMAQLKVYGRDGDQTRVSEGAPRKMSRRPSERALRALPKNQEFIPNVIWKSPKEYIR